MVSRLTEQKGLDLLLEAVPEIIKRGGQLVVFGTGDPALENGLKHAAHAHPESVAVELGFDETLAHTIIAGSDVVAVPSRFEPCGLTQLYALAYGSLPLVHCVGGLADTVVDASLENLADDLATGFVFERFEPKGTRGGDPPRVRALRAPHRMESHPAPRDATGFRLGRFGRALSGLVSRTSLSSVASGVASTPPTDGSTQQHGDGSTRA